MKMSKRERDRNKKKDFLKDLNQFGRIMIKADGLVVLDHNVMPASQVANKKMKQKVLHKSYSSTCTCTIVYECAKSSVRQKGILCLTFIKLLDNPN